MGIAEGKARCTLGCRRRFEPLDLRQADAKVKLNLDDHHISRRSYGTLTLNAYGGYGLTNADLEDFSVSLGRSSWTQVLLASY